MILVNIFNVRSIFGKLLHNSIFYLAEIQYIYNVVYKRNIIINVLNFMQRFPNEASCITYLKE